MLPEGYVKEQENRKLRKENWRKVTVSALFLLSFLILGPLLHELSHIAVLMMKGCAFTHSFGFGLSGFHGYVQPLCHLRTPSLTLFYMAGYISTVGVGVLSLETESVKKNDYAASIGFGILFSTLLSMGSHNDVLMTTNALELPVAAGLGLALLIFLGVSSYGLQKIELLLDVSERK